MHSLPPWFLGESDFSFFACGRCIVSLLFLLVVVSFKASKNFFPINNGIANIMHKATQQSIIENDQIRI